MILDKNLDFALKYNWRTKDDDKNNISLITKISYVFLKWKSEELFFVFKNLSLKDLEKAFELVKKDNFSLKEKRKLSINTLLIEKRHERI